MPFHHSPVVSSAATPTHPISPRRFIRRCHRTALLGFVLSSAALSVSQTPRVWAQSRAAAEKPVVLSKNKIAIKINGELAEVTPPPVLTTAGSVLVPLRGVLEKLSARVDYTAAEQKIEVRQSGKVYVLRVGQKGASVGTASIELTAAPMKIGPSVYVPLRSMVETFGYRVEWDNANKTVLISTDLSPINFANHRAALIASRNFGIGVDFTGVDAAQVGPLLDLARQAGVDTIQTRFDWNTIQPTASGAFDFSLYDTVVQEARKRDLLVVGILGDSAQWASQSRSAIPREWRFNVPRADQLPAFGNYVERTVAHYGQDVQAWQVWDQPISWKFRASSFKFYQSLVKTALQAARRADPKAIIHAAEPGGINLTFLSGLKNDPALMGLDGVALYPSSQWQPGIPVAPEELVLPLSTYQDKLSLGRDTWMGGLWWPALEGNGVARPEGEQFYKVSDERRTEIESVFTAQSQADYLLRTSALSLAQGANKVFWNRLRDEPAYDTVEPVNPEWGSGLVRTDNTLRPSYAAMQTLTRLIGDPKFKFVGPIATGPDVVALVFDDGDTGHVVAWSPSGAGELVLGSGENPNVANAQWLKTRADSTVLNSIGAPVGSGTGALSLKQNPVWITQVAIETVTRAKENWKEMGEQYLALTRPLPRSTDKNVARATFGAQGVENGLLWRKYQQFRGQATETRIIDNEAALMAQIPPSVLRPADGKPYLFFDVSDDFLFFEKGVPVTVTVRVAKTSGAANSGFKIEYNSPTGTRATSWQLVESGDGWVNYDFEIPDASFGNVNGSDFTVNAFGSKQNLLISEVTVKKKAVAGG